MKVINETRGTVLAEHALCADSFFSRLVGLLNRSFLSKGEALVLAPSNSIHSFFMRFSIDAVFLNKDYIVVGLLCSFRPFRISPLFLSARLTIELPEDTINSSATELGDRIRIINPA